MLYVLIFLGVCLFAATGMWLEYLINGRARRKRILRLREELDRERH